jgi:hypothetical protein
VSEQTAWQVLPPRQVTAVDRHGQEIRTINGYCSDFLQLAGNGLLSARAWFTVLPEWPHPAPGEHAYFFDHARGQTFRALCLGARGGRVSREELGLGFGPPITVHIVEFSSDGKPEPFTSVESHGWAYEPKGGPK